MLADCPVRGELARASLTIADDESRDADVLKQAALNGMALDHKGRPGAPAAKIGCPATGPHVPWQMRGFANRAVRPRPARAVLSSCLLGARPFLSQALPE
jgi:hypothetical protein